MFPTDNELVICHKVQSIKDNSELIVLKLVIFEQTYLMNAKPCNFP